MTLFLLLAILLGLVIPYFQRRYSTHRRRHYLRKARHTVYWGVGCLCVAFLLWFFKIRL